MVVHPCNPYTYDNHKLALREIVRIFLNPKTIFNRSKEYKGFTRGKIVAKCQGIDRWIIVLLM